MGWGVLRALTQGERAGLGVLVLVAVSAAFRVSPVWDAVDGSEVPFAALVQPVTYLVAAPLFGVWDTLSLLTLTQHYAVLATIVALYFGVRSKARRGAGSFPLRALREVVRGGIALVLLLVFYAAGVLLPRPMVGLRIDDPDRLSVDFHSHTRYSHDGWSLFTPLRNRAWHEAGGFDVAYVTDHYTWEGYDVLAPLNPERAGDRLVMLSGAEIRIYRRPTNILGARERYEFALDTSGIYLEPDSIAAGFARSGRRPTLFYTMPGRLEFLVPYSEEVPSGMVGVELNDGSPRGLEQVKAERAQIIALADSLNLALLGAANLHGWGRTVASWSVLDLPGWQDLTPGGLADEIEELLHERRREAVQVVERRMPYHGGAPLRLMLTAPAVGWAHLTMLSEAERLSWMLWIGLLVAVGRVRRSRAAGANTPAAESPEDEAVPGGSRA